MHVFVCKLRIWVFLQELSESRKKLIYWNVLFKGFLLPEELKLKEFTAIIKILVTFFVPSFLLGFNFHALYFFEVWDFKVNFVHFLLLLYPELWHRGINFLLFNFNHILAQFSDNSFFLLTWEVNIFKPGIWAFLFFSQKI